ncbi:MAG TPA: tRNA uridine(34) 5-carboxymethylaminomethyl modification radical SAM/GNAT enzyme Elp3 [Anaerolineaceae bacterium]|nr:tRNA uridine(34) 5-carboxymethylaminomethyl modification radical SAM/GNAT enzyme Elp3 [Anaerolineaceae bacterium]
MKKTKEAWRTAKQYTPEERAIARLVLDEVKAGAPLMKAIHAHPLKAGGYIAKHALIAQYQQLVQTGTYPDDPVFLSAIRMKPIRSLSGVTTVTVLTKPFPCPGDCIFCPDDQELPKSYLREEPGAARAFENQFDPFLQVSSRLASYDAIGHPTSKIELLILGGCWTAYPADYQTWFIQRCLDAMNGVDSTSLEEAQAMNVAGERRNVGLVIETRPDAIDAAVLARLRQLGVTKVQIGAQSFDDRILAMNRRGHTAADTLQAIALLRAAGFKIVMHWMPNLMGATIASDRDDFKKMWEGGYCPDEIKIYPTQLVENSQLYQYWQRDAYKPYTTQELVQLIADVKLSIPEYCRVNRVIRDIPATYIVDGNKRSSLRQDVQNELKARGERCRCVRCREIRGKLVDEETLMLDEVVYHPACSEEHFLHYRTPDDHLAGYLRLSFPDSTHEQGQQVYQQVYQHIPELRGCAIIREVHIYGQSLRFGTENTGAAQHVGLGSRLIEKAVELCRERGIQQLAVIAAIGTRHYYFNRGFTGGKLYMLRRV